jgi:hypothetical protein
MKTKTFVEGNAALKNFTDAMSVLFRATKPTVKKSSANKKRGKR